jgi:hypothetical protein
MPQSVPHPVERAGHIGRCCSLEESLPAAELLDRFRPGRGAVGQRLGCRLSERDRSAVEWCLDRGRPVRSPFRCPSLLESRLPAAELLDRVRPGRGTVGQRLGWRRRHSERDRCAVDRCLDRGRSARHPFRRLSFLESRLPAAELLDRSHPSARSRSPRGLKLDGRRLGRRRCGRNIDAGHSGAVEHQPLRTLWAGRASEDVALNSTHRGGVGLHLHQAHRRAACYALHHAPPNYACTWNPSAAGCQAVAANCAWVWPQGHAWPLNLAVHALTRQDERVVGP